MSFWNSINRKARKEYNCAYCEKVIQKGEQYSRETGTYGDEILDYCLCLRCRWLIDTFEAENEYMASLFDTLDNNDLVL